MSAAPFNPMPDQLQQDSGSPAVDVMAPPDQSAPAPQPTATPNYPASPDQGGPVPQAAQVDSDAGSSTHGWRAVLRGALQGLESHLKGAGEGLITGGVPGALVGAVNPAMADNAMKFRNAIQTANVQKAQAQAQLTQEQAKDADVVMALNQVHLLQAQIQTNRLPLDIRQEAQQAQEKDLRANYSAAMDSGNGQVVQEFGDWNDADTWNAYRSLAGQYNSNGAMDPHKLVPAVNPAGNLVMMRILDPSRAIGQDISVDTGEKNADGSPLMYTIPAGTPYANALDQMAKVNLKKLDTAGKVAVQGKKNEGSANVATIKANAATAKAAGTGEWVPKVTADEKKKAELAENIAENANGVAQILMRRPDIVGAVAGRFTSTEQMVGNNDPDISALGTRIHNIAMANSGVHGFRSQEGVKSTESLLLNNFKNGPKAVAGALRANVDSVQTFIDNARPDTYRTHSKQGGAMRAMVGK